MRLTLRSAWHAVNVSAVTVINVIIKTPKNTVASWWCIPESQAFGRLRHKDPYEFEPHPHGHVVRIYLKVKKQTTVLVFLN